MKLTDILLERNCGCGQTPCKTYGLNEELGVAKKQLEAILNKVGPDVFAKIIIDGIQDENDQDDILDAIKKVNMDQFASDIF